MDEKRAIEDQCGQKDTDIDMDELRNLAGKGERCGTPESEGTDHIRHQIDGCWIPFQDVDQYAEDRGEHECVEFQSVTTWMTAR